MHAPASPAPRQIYKTAKEAGIYTTGHVSKICCVAPRTVSKWCDTGRLKHFRIPGSQDRRIVRADLIRFLDQYGMPKPPELMDPAILVVGMPGLRLIDGLRTYHAPNAFAAGALSVQHRPRVIVVDVTATGRLDARTIAACASASEPRPWLVAVSDEPVPGFDRTCPAAGVEAAIWEALA